jgi:hypothetical protein
MGPDAAKAEQAKLMSPTSARAHVTSGIAARKEPNPNAHVPSLFDFESPEDEGKPSIKPNIAHLLSSPQTHAILHAAPPAETERDVPLAYIDKKTGFCQTTANKKEYNPRVFKDEVELAAAPHTLGPVDRSDIKRRPVRLALFCVRLCMCVCVSVSVCVCVCACE